MPTQQTDIRREKMSTKKQKNSGVFPSEAKFSISFQQHGAEYNHYQSRRDLLITKPTPSASVYFHPPPPRLPLFEDGLLTDCFRLFDPQHISWINRNLLPIRFFGSFYFEALSSGYLHMLAKKLSVLK